MSQSSLQWAQELEAPTAVPPPVPLTKHVTQPQQQPQANPPPKESDE
jgi:hypothetical protein